MRTRIVLVTLLITSGAWTRTIDVSSINAGGLVSFNVFLQDHGTGLNMETLSGGESHIDDRTVYIYYVNEANNKSSFTLQADDTWNVAVYACVTLDNTNGTYAMGLQDCDFLVSLRNPYGDWMASAHVDWIETHGIPYSSQYIVPIGGSALYYIGINLKVPLSIITKTLDGSSRINVTCSLSPVANNKYITKTDATLAYLMRPLPTPTPTATYTPTPTPTPAKYTYDLAAHHIGVQAEIPEGYNKGYVSGALRSLGSGQINKTDIGVDYWLYPEGNWGAAQRIHQDNNFGPFDPGQTETHIYNIQRIWVPGRYQIRMIHDFSDEDSSNNYLDSAVLRVVTSTPTVPPTSTFTPTFTPTNTPTGTRTPTPTYTPTYTPTPTKSTYTNDLAAWDLQITGSYMEGWIKNVGTNNFDIGSGQDGLRVKFYRKNKGTGIVSFIKQDRIPGADWPVGRVDSYGFTANIWEWDYGTYDVWIEHDASNPTSESLYSEQDENLVNDFFHIEYNKYTPTPTRTRTPTPIPTPTKDQDISANYFFIPYPVRTPSYGGSKTITFTGVLANASLRSVTEDDITATWYLCPYPGEVKDAYASGIVTEFGPFGPYPLVDWYEGKDFSVSRNWQTGIYRFYWKSNYDDQYHRDANPANDAIWSSTFTILPSPTMTPTRAPLGLVIELDNKIWYFTRTGIYQTP